MTLTFMDTILRHRGEAGYVTYLFRLLSATEQYQIVAFLGSL
jgi:hypothetical protein